MATAPDKPEAVCRFAGHAYSPGALVRMGRSEMACIVKDGTPAWVRPAY